MQPIISTTTDVNTEMEARLKSVDWAATPLNPPSTWPPSLRVAVDLCLRSTLPMDILWGPEFIQIYNDAYRPILGAKHPGSFGQSARECWAEIWDSVGPLLHGVLSTGIPCWREDFPLVVRRNGFAEETYFSFSYAPIRDDSGETLGVFAAARETTASVVGRRRQSLLHDLVVRTANCATIDEVLAALTVVFASERRDIVDAALYSDGGDGSPRAKVMMATSEPVATRGTAHLQTRRVRHAVRQTLRSREPRVVLDRAAVGGGRTGTVVLPVEVRGRQPMTCALALTVSPLLRYDEDYRQFLEIVASHVASALARVRAREDERRQIAEESRRVHEERTKALLRRQAIVFETVAEAVWITDADGVIVSINPAAARLTGWTREALVGQNISVMRPDMSDAGSDAAIREAARRDGLWAGEMVISCFDGRVRVLEATAVPQMGADGNPVGFIRVARDVTERRRAERSEAGRSRALELVATGATVERVLGALLDEVGRQLPGVRGALCRREQHRLEVTASIGLSSDDVRRIEALEVAASGGVAGVVAFRGEPLLLQEEELSTPLGAGVPPDTRCTFVTPIVTPERAVLGILALYWPDPRQPGGEEFRVVTEARDLAAIAIARDNAERQLRRQAVVFESLTDAVLMTDADGRVTDWNPAMEGLTGFTLAETQGLSARHVLMAGMDDETRQQVRAAVLAQGAWTGEVFITRKDGTARLCELKVVADRGPTMALPGSMCLLRDITERSRAEQAIRESEERYRLVTETASDVIITIGLDGRILLANPASEPVLGWHPDELVGRNLTVLIPARLVEPHLSGMRRYAETGTRTRSWKAVELTALHRDGSEVPVEISFGESRGSGGHVLTGVIRDIRERRRAQEKVREQSERLARIVQIQQTVASTTLKPAAVMRRICESALSLTGADGAVVGLIDGEGITFAYGTGCFTTQAGMKVPRAQSVAGECLRLGRVIRIDDARTHPLTAASPGLVDTRSVLTIPLRYNQEEIGVLSIGSTRCAAFSESDEQVLTLAAGVLAAALSHAMAFEAKRKLVLERTDALAALQKSEERFRALSECSPDGIFAADSSGACTYVNRRLPEMLGGMPGDYLGMAWQQRLHPDDRAFIAQWSLATGAGRPVSASLRFIGARGEEILVQLQSAPLVLETGHIEGFVGTLLDITDRKLAEEALRHAERQYRELVESVDAIVWRASGDPLRMTFVSRQVEEILGCDQAVLRQASLWGDHLHPDDRVAVLREMDRAAHNRGVVRHDFRAIRSTGEPIWLRSLMHRIDDRPEIIGLTFDVTEVWTVRNELYDSRQELRTLAAQLQTVREKERSAIAREIHDELGQALTCLKLDVAWLRRKLPRRAAALIASTDQIVAQIDTTLDTVRRIATELRPHVLDSLGLAAALEWLVLEFQRRTQIRTAFENDDETLTLDHDASTAVFRIVQEALTNAARHGGAKSVRVTVTADDHWITFGVQDDGCGMPAPQTPPLASLGLLIMHERARMCGGEVELRSRPGAGTLVVVRVPRATMRHRPAIST